MHFVLKWCIVELSRSIIRLARQFVHCLAASFKITVPAFSSTADSLKGVVVLLRELSRAVACGDIFCGWFWKGKLILGNVALKLHNLEFSVGLWAAWSDRCFCGGIFSCVVRCQHPLSRPQV